MIGADGSLTGFGGGLATKRALLDLEQSLSLFLAAAPATRCRLARDIRVAERRWRTA